MEDLPLPFISGQLMGDNERLCAMELHLLFKRFPSPAGFEPGTTLTF